MSHDDDKTQPVDVDAHPQPLAWRRAVLVAFLAVFLSLVFYFRTSTTPGPKIIYATRYSKEFKYRPAASPIITERLKDGTIRLRGAIPP